MIDELQSVSADSDENFKDRPEMNKESIETVKQIIMQANQDGTWRDSDQVLQLMNKTEIEVQEIYERVAPLIISKDQAITYICYDYLRENGGEMAEMVCSKSRLYL